MKSAIEVATEQTEPAPETFEQTCTRLNGLIRQHYKTPIPIPNRLPPQFHKAIPAKLKTELRELWAADLEVDAKVVAMHGESAVQGELNRQREALIKNPETAKIPQSREEIRQTMLQRRLALFEGYARTHGTKHYELHRQAYALVLGQVEEEVIELLAHDHEEASELGFARADLPPDFCTASLVRLHEVLRGKVRHIEADAKHLADYFKGATLGIGKIACDPEVMSLFGIEKPEPKK